MNRAVAAVYAITIGGSLPPYTAEERIKLVECIPALIDEINRLEKIAHDPFVKGYVERFGVGKSDGR